MITGRPPRFPLLLLVLLVAACTPRSRQADDRRGADDDDASDAWEGTWSGVTDGEFHRDELLDGDGTAQFEIDGSDLAVGSVGCTFDGGGIVCAADVSLQVGEEVAAEVSCLPGEDAHVWLRSNNEGGLRVFIANEDEFTIFSCGADLEIQVR